VNSPVALAFSAMAPRLFSEQSERETALAVRPALSAPDGLLNVDKFLSSMDSTARLRPLVCGALTIKQARRRRAPLGGVGTQRPTPDLNVSGWSNVPIARPKAMLSKKTRARHSAMAFVLPAG
jgi:hypothetical protein